MMKNNSVYITTDALRYAQALIELDLTQGKLDELREECFDTELYEMLSNPVVASVEKHKVLDEVIEDKNSRNFLKVLISRGDILILESIIYACEKLLLEKDETKEAKITYVFPPSEKQLKKMEKFVCEKHNCKHVKWDMSEDKDLISGFILYVDGTLYDYSMSGRLNKLKQDLTGRK